MPSMGALSLDILTITGLVGIMVLIVCLRFSKPLLTTSGPLPPSSVKYMVTVITIVATLFSQLVTSRIRYLFLRSFESRLRNMSGPRGSGPLPDPVALDGQGRSEAFDKLDRKWRGALGIDRLFSEKLKNAKFLSAYLLSGLITTTIVIALTPTVVNQRVPYHPVIPDANYGEYTNDTYHSCVGLAASNRTLGTAYRWDLNNGSTFYGSTDLGYCPPSKAMALSSGINSQNPDDYVYVDSGVAVRRTAIGAPAAIYKGSVLEDLSHHYGRSLINTTQCVPVMDWKSNPVQCRLGGSLKVASDNRLTAVSGDPNCNRSYTYPKNFTRDSAMLNFMCSNNRNDTSESVGLVTIFFGGFSDPNGKNPFAADLAGTMNDQDKNAGFAGSSTYAVTCTVNPRSSFVYRTVTLDLQAIKSKNQSDYAYYLSGGESCTPVNATISNVLFATAATANHNLVREHYGEDWYFSAIHNAAGSRRGPPYAFSNSRNALEDTLGLVAALAVSSLHTTGAGYGGNVRADASDSNAYAFAEVTRLGTDKLEALLLLIPPFGSFVILAVLFTNNLRHDRGPGGKRYEGLSKHKKDKCPQLYAAESIYELLLLGRSYGLDSHSTGLSSPASENKRAHVSGHRSVQLPQDTRSE